MRLASRGLRDLDDGVAPIAAAADRNAVRRQARRVMRRSIGAAAVTTAVYLLASG